MLVYCCAFRSFSASVEYTAVVDAIVCVTASIDPGLRSRCKNYLGRGWSLLRYDSLGGGEIEDFVGCVESVKKKLRYTSCPLSLHVLTQCT